jgi:hypothetical protein
MTPLGASPDLASVGTQATVETFYDDQDILACMLCGRC